MVFSFGRNKAAPAGTGRGTLKVVKSRCPANHKCPSIAVCPESALSQKGFSAPEVDREKCIGCGKCVRRCPMRALVIE